MAVQSLLPTTHLLYSNGVSANLSPLSTKPIKGLVFNDFAGFYCKSKRTRRKIGVGSSRGSLVKTWSNAKAVLSLEGKISNIDSKKKSQSKVANLEDILSERGACGVGFIANLDNIPSHQIIKDALTALGCMEHRGGCGADNDSGDGSGLMTLIPWDLFDNWANKQGLASLDKAHTGVGMVFLPKDDESAKEAKRVIIETFKQEGLEVLGWRPVPVNASIVGRFAKETMPNIQQVFVKILKDEEIGDIEREMYICRKLIEKAVKTEKWE